MYEPKRNEVTAVAYFHYVKFIKSVKAPTDKEFKKILKETGNNNNELL